MGRKQQMPVQERPLYAFFIKNGTLEHKIIIQYNIVPTRHGNNYKFIDGSMKTKSEAQLDRALNGYVYTFDSDSQHAIEIFRARAESDIIRAQALLQSARTDMDDIMMAVSRLKQTK